MKASHELTHGCQPTGGRRLLDRFRDEGTQRRQSQNAISKGIQISLDGYGFAAIRNAIYSVLHCARQVSAVTVGIISLRRRRRTRPNHYVERDR
jgi:hypothetical protein